uniref:DNA methyltransferase 1 associated protein 1 n=1 Tax=Callithrix jacchus TaxID=9483 RepID=A0A5F4VRH4_CALJA
LQEGAALFNKYLLHRAVKVGAGHFFGPCFSPYLIILSALPFSAHGFQSSKAAPFTLPPQKYHYFLVRVFLALCHFPNFHKQEVWKFRVLMLSGREMEKAGTFHLKVQVILMPQLPNFNSRITGIRQDSRDGNPSLHRPVEGSGKWLAKEGLLIPNMHSIYTTCIWDLRVLQPGQQKYLCLPMRDYGKQVIHLRKLYS